MKKFTREEIADAVKVSRESYPEEIFPDKNMIMGQTRFIENLCWNLGINSLETHSQDENKNAPWENKGLPSDIAHAPMVELKQLLDDGVLNKK